MNFKEKKQEYIDAEGFRLLSFIEDKVIQPKSKTKSKLSGSVHQMIAVDLTDKMIDSPHFESEQDYSGIISKREIYQNRSVGLDSTNYVKIKKLVNTVIDEKSIKYKISKEFVEDKIFEWLVKAQKANKTLSTFLLDEFTAELKNLRVRFPIVNLNIDKPFKIGKAKFDYFTEDYFDRLIKFHEQKGLNSSSEQLSHLRQKYQGKVFVCYDILAEKKRAEEIALEYCSLTVDILKMCSDTLDMPDLKLGFDIDSRVSFASQSEVIFSSAENELDELNINFYGPTARHQIGAQQWEFILRRGLGSFHTFLLSLGDEPTELETLIVNSIKRYGNAISTVSLHQRVVELFTILESLLLLNTNTPIIESVCRYCSKLVFKTIDDRKQSIELLKNMYDVRSKLIHHGKEVSFELENLRKLQYIVVELFNVLVHKTKEHTSKQSLLNEIEDAILRAYI